MTVEVSVLKNADKIAAAIDNLTEHIGGGASFGPLQSVVIGNDLPAIGDEFMAYPQVLSISSGGTMIAGGNTYSPISTPIAAGLTAVSFAEAQYTECDAYVCGVEPNEEDTSVYTSVTPWDGTVTVGSIEQWGNQSATYTLTVPELDHDPETGTGEYLVLYVHEA